MFCFKCIKNWDNGNRMAAIKTLELAALTREQPMLRAKNKRKRNFEKAGEQAYDEDFNKTNN